MKEGHRKRRGEGRKGEERGGKEPERIEEKEGGQGSL